MRHYEEGTKVIRSYLKKVFSPGIGVESLSQVLDILEYACGLILGLALISNENPNFEIASSSVHKPSVSTLMQVPSH
jgi:tryptophan synthase alpha subunit